jgi:Nif-specific regulatory protein
MITLDSDRGGTSTVLSDGGMVAPVPTTSLQDELIRIRRERDLYLRLIRLGEANDLEPFLEEALALVVEITGAKQGYIELVDDGAGDERRWWLGHGFSTSEIAGVRALLSRGIIGEALASRQTILTGAATQDPRFRDFDSVRGLSIEAVLCAPIGNDPPLGVVYLQGRTQGGTFVEEDRATVEEFAHHLAPFADRLLQHRRRRDEADATRPLRAKMRVELVVGRSAALGNTLQQVALVAPLNVDVLLLGDTGTGKTQLARVIHDNSPRAAGPFVEVNCSTLPENLVESELFGALPGSHSTATHKIDGKVASAQGGTLVLDEVAELPDKAQAKLLQLIQSRQYFPLGATKPLAADVRVIAATNIDLQAAVAARRFREDLYYRLLVLPIRVPALAERRDDVPLLAERFVQAAAERYRLPVLPLSPAATRALQVAEWPGNVRQLEHVMQAALIRATGLAAQQIERTHVFPDTPAGARLEQAETFQDATRRFQASLVRQALEDSGWNVIEASRRLDIARSHLYTLIRAFGLERKG